MRVGSDVMGVGDVLQLSINSQLLIGQFTLSVLVK